MRLTPMLIGAAILIVVALATNALWRSGPTTASSETGTDMRTITVSGQGEASAVPDQASIQLGVTSEAPAAQAALARNNTAMAAIIAGLKKMGIADKHIQTSNFSVSPQYAPFVPGQTGPQRITGYQVSNTVSATVTEMAKLGDILDQVVGLGANTINGVNFSIKDDAAVLKTARENAIADAKLRAETYAAAAGIKVGRVLGISETASVRPVPYAAVRALRVAAADSVPIEAGEQELSVSVTVQFEIQ